MKKSLEELRKEIDKADEEILAALARRLDVVREIGELKKELNILPLDESRWQQVIEQITKKAKQRNLPEELIKNIYEEIHQEALIIEKNE